MAWTPRQKAISLGRCHVQTATDRFGPEARTAIRDRERVGLGFTPIGGEVPLIWPSQDPDSTEEHGRTRSIYHVVPAVQSHRNNLTALAQTFNLYFAAYHGRIFIYRPRSDPAQLLTRFPDLQLVPRKSRVGEKAPGYLDRRAPHSINHIATGFLGEREIVVATYDNGEVVAYNIDEIFKEISELKRSQAVAASEGRPVKPQPHALTKPFLTENVGSSAWGIAIHSRSRLLAVSSNLHEIVVFAFALSSSSGEASNGSSDDAECENAGNLEAHVRQRERTWRIIIALPATADNMPNVSFLDDGQGEAEKVCAMDIHGALWIADIWKPKQPACQLRATGHAAGNFGNRGWGVIPLPVESFVVVETMRDLLGGEIRLSQGTNARRAVDINPLLQNIWDDPCSLLRQRRSAVIDLSQPPLPTQGGSSLPSISSLFLPPTGGGTPTTQAQQWALATGSFPFPGANVGPWAAPFDPLQPMPPQPPPMPLTLDSEMPPLWGPAPPAPEETLELAVGNGPSDAEPAALFDPDLAADSEPPDLMAVATIEDSDAGNMDDDADETDEEEVSDEGIGDSEFQSADLEEGEDGSDAEIGTDEAPMGVMDFMIASPSSSDDEDSLPEGPSAVTNAGLSTGTGQSNESNTPGISSSPTSAQINYTITWGGPGSQPQVSAIPGSALGTNLQPNFLDSLMEMIVEEGQTTWAGVSLSPLNPNYWITTPPASALPHPSEQEAAGYLQQLNADIQVVDAASGTVTSYKIHTRERTSSHGVLEQRLVTHSSTCCGLKYVETGSEPLFLPMVYQPHKEQCDDMQSFGPLLGTVKKNPRSSIFTDDSYSTLSKRYRFLSTFADELALIAPPRSHTGLTTLIPEIRCSNLVPNSLEHMSSIDRNRLRAAQRLSMLAHVPELGLLVVGSQTGRVVLMTPTRLSGRRREVFGEAWEYGYRIEAVLPFQSDETRFRQTKRNTLHGLAVGPAMYGEGAWDSGPKRFRLVLHYSNHDILTYEVGRGHHQDRLFLF